MGILLGFGLILLPWSIALPDEGSQSLEPSEDLRTANARWARHAAQAGQYWKAIQALTSESLASPSDKVYTEMLFKHPQSPPPPCFPTIIPPSIDTVEGLVAKAIRSFPSGSAPGPSLLRANHLKEAITCPSPECGLQFLKVLTSVVKLLAVGLAPHEVIPHLCGVFLLAVKKKGGVIVLLLLGRSCIG